MAFGSETYRANGSKAMDGANASGIFVKAITVWYGSAANGSEVFPQIPAGSMYIVIAQAGGQYEPSIGDDGTGHAKLSWTYYPYGASFVNSTSDTTFLVFARKVIQTESHGILTYNDIGDQLNDYRYPVPQYAGTVQPAAAPTMSYVSPDGIYQLNVHTVRINFRATTNRLVMVNVPDSSSNDVWYSCYPFIKANEVVYENGAYNTSIPVELYILRRAGQPYQVPSLHVFSLDGPVSGGSTFGTQYFNASGALVYDSSAENVSIRDQQPLTFPTRGSPANTLAMNMPSQAGVVIPYFYQSIYHAQAVDINGNRGYYENWRGMVQRRGNTLYAKTIDFAHNTVYDPSGTGTHFDSQFGRQTGGSAMIVDISELSPSSVAGTPGTVFN